MMNRKLSQFKALLALISGRATWSDLYLTSRLFHKVGNNRLFECAVSTVDPSFFFPKLQEAKFIDRGAGRGSLNCYRKCSLDDNIVFEKIYDSLSADWRRARWYAQQMSREPLLVLRAPQIFLVEESAKVSAIYYEFFDNWKGTNSSLIVEQAKKWTRSCMQISIAKGHSSIVDFRDVPLYQEGLRRLRASEKRLELKGDILTTIEDAVSIMGMRYGFFAHGDFSRNNVDIHDRIIDFDACGIYPPGFDLGYSIGRYDDSMTLRCLKKIWSEIDVADHQDTVMSFFWFCAIFGSLRSTSPLRDEQIRDLVMYCARLR